MVNFQKFLETKHVFLLQNAYYEIHSIKIQKLKRFIKIIAFKLLLTNFWEKNNWFHHNCSTNRKVLILNSTNFFYKSICSFELFSIKVNLNQNVIFINIRNLLIDFKQKFNCIKLVVQPCQLNLKLNFHLQSAWQFSWI